MRRISSGRILKISFSMTGKSRATVCLSHNGIQRTHQVSHLVAEAFLGPRPDGLIVRHWDDDPANNAPTNLRYGTYSQNSADSVRNGTHHEAGKARCHRNHPFSEENTAIERNGGRRCLACARDRNREWYNRRKRSA